MNKVGELSKVLETIGEIDNPKSAPENLSSILKTLISLSGQKAGMLRMEYDDGSRSINIESAEKLPTFCFSRLDAPECICGNAIATSKPKSHESEFKGKIEGVFCNQAGFTTVVNAPISVSGNGNAVTGFLFLAGYQNLDLDVESIELAAKHLGLLAGRLEKHFETEKRLKNLETVSRVGTIISSQLELKELTRSVVDHLGKVIKNDRVNLVAYNQKEEALEFIATVISGEVDTNEPEVYPLSDGMNSWIIKNRRPLLIKENTVEECRAMGIRHGGKPAKSWLGVPILHRGMILGVLSVQCYKEAYAYNNSSTELLSMVANQVGVAMENARLYESTARREVEKQKLYFSLTHDLLSLVTPVSGYGEVISRMDPADFASRQNDLGKNLTSSANRITQFVEDILTFSQIQSGKLELHPENANLYQIIDHSVSNFQSELNMRKIDLYIEGKKVMDTFPRFPKKVVTCDTLQIERVLNNCIQNAVKHASSKVELTTANTKKAVACTIYNDGKGMERALSSKVFDEYFQADRGKKGVGLGLPSVKRIVELHGGNVDIDTDLGKGFAFTFSLPVKAVKVNG
jgi:signal transduction histidine kinase